VTERTGPTSLDELRRRQREAWRQAGWPARIAAVLTCAALTAALFGVTYLGVLSGFRDGCEVLAEVASVTPPRVRVLRVTSPSKKPVIEGLYVDLDPTDCPTPWTAAQLALSCARSVSHQDWGTWTCHC
jgi:hypothetical protein